MCEKTTSDVADGIDRSLQMPQRLITARYSTTTGDVGGRGAVKNIIRDLITRDSVLYWEQHI